MTKGQPKKVSKGKNTKRTVASVQVTSAQARAILAAEMARRGRKGGKTRSPKRAAASAANLKRARAARWGDPFAVFGC